MPDYEYECKSCYEHFTVKESFAEHERHRKTNCPKCGSKDVERLLGHVYVKTAKKS